ncbi:hypothetical protein F2P81_018944 [Scophthalmus maximus]|uniref:Uncharacterized protein n=1 Tax=Scophthalmus maximus TaxID=52904 RepID=A0A6A4SB41_SCOMX|nr:hypothetical protein F2P81_018944 [Scophthalmus maximus]
MSGILYDVKHQIISKTKEKVTRESRSMILYQHELYSYAASPQWEKCPLTFGPDCESPAFITTRSYEKKSLCNIRIKTHVNNHRNNSSRP